MSATNKGFQHNDHIVGQVSNAMSLYLCCILWVDFLGIELISDGLEYK